MFAETRSDFFLKNRRDRWGGARLFKLSPDDVLLHILRLLLWWGMCSTPWRDVRFGSFRLQRPPQPAAKAERLSKCPKCGTL